MTPEEFSNLIIDPLWRINHLYTIIGKGENGEELKLQFVLNRAQKKLLSDGLWHRNIILKVRQLGFTTLIAIIFLDTALFSKNPIACGIIAHDRDHAENIFRNKIRYAYENLPEPLRKRFPLSRESATELRFAHNGASIRVATSMRSDTIHRLHISEFGKISSNYPDKAREVITGSIPAVPATGMVIIESTAEGAEGEFYDMTQLAIQKAERRLTLTPMDYKFHFFPWMDEQHYELDPHTILIPERLTTYFDELERETGQPIPARKRAWYVGIMSNNFSGDQQKMFQEYPSTPAEAFRVSIEGCYYTRELSCARRENRICRIPIESAVPINTFWDFGHSGRSDATGIWFHQRIGPENRFLAYHEFEMGATLADYAKYLLAKNWIYGTHYLPHDADYKVLGADPDHNRSRAEMLHTLLPHARIEIVPRITELSVGIDAVRNVFGTCWFDEAACSEALHHLASYKREWDDRRGIWTKKPRHDEHSHCADAFRQFAQIADRGEAFRQAEAASLQKRHRARNPKTRWVM